MARPRKKGLDYFPFDVDFFSDRKIKRLRAKFGNDGVSVYIYLLCEIYRNCYFTQFDEDLILDISDELNISENATKQIINYLLSRSLFDGKLAESVKVLTAESVQRRYLKAKGLSAAAIEDQYLLVKSGSDDTSGEAYPDESFSGKNNGFSEKKPGFSEKNSTKESKEKHSKVNESKAEESRYFPPKPTPLSAKNTCLSQENYDALVYDYGKKVIDEYLDKIEKWTAKKNISIGDYEGMMRKWITQDGIKPIDHSVDKYNCVINQF